MIEKYLIALLIITGLQVIASAATLGKRYNDQEEPIFPVLMFFAGIFAFVIVLLKSLGANVG